MIEVECHACGALYGIPEERARGRVLKIRCKDCTNVFEVRGEVPADDQPEWFAVIDKSRVGPMSRVEVVTRRDKGEILDHTFLWKEGMEEWLRCSELPEFAGRRPDTENTSLGPSENTRRIRHPETNRPIKILRDSPAEQPSPDKPVITSKQKGKSQAIASDQTVDVSSDMALAATQHVEADDLAGDYPSKASEEAALEGRDDDSFPTDRFGNSVPTEKVVPDSSVGTQGRRSNDSAVHLSDSDILDNLRPPTETGRREHTEVMVDTGDGVHSGEDTNRVAVEKVSPSQKIGLKAPDDHLDDMTERVSPLKHYASQGGGSEGSGLGTARVLFGLLAVGVLALAIIYFMRPELFSLGSGESGPNGGVDAGSAKAPVISADAAVAKRPVATALDAQAPDYSAVSAALDAADGQPSDQGFSPDVAVAVDSAAVKVRQKKKKRRRKRRKKRRPKGDDELDNLMNDGP